MTLYIFSISLKVFFYSMQTWKFSLKLCSTSFFTFDFMLRFFPWNVSINFWIVIYRHSISVVKIEKKIEFSFSYKLLFCWMIFNPFLYEILWNIETAKCNNIFFFNKLQFDPQSNLTCNPIWLRNILNYNYIYLWTVNIQIK